jgi:nitroreductase
MNRVNNMKEDSAMSLSKLALEMVAVSALVLGSGCWSRAYRPEPQKDALLLPNPEPGMSDVNRFAAAFFMVLSHVGVPADPVQVAGDSGLAFILQADSLEHAGGADHKELDIGAWPLAYWGAMLRLDFLGRAYGVPMRRLGCVEAEFRADSAAHYRKRYHSEVLRSLQAGRPLVAVADGDDPYVVYGCDSGNPPLLGQVPCDTRLKVERMEEYPWEVIVLGEPGASMDRRQADAEALEFGLRLWRDEVDLSDWPGKLTGRRAWELWLSQLEDPELCGPHYYHNNVIIHLRQNRRAAAAYLRAMSQRHSGRAAEALISAAAGFDAVLEKLKQADTSRDTYNTDAGRQSLISVLRETMALEAKAFERMAEALGAMREGGMNPVIETIYHRRSIRSYTADPVPAELRDEILRAGCSAPHGGPEEPWRFLVIEKADIKQQLLDAYKRAKDRQFGGPSKVTDQYWNAFFAKAPLVIAVAFKPTSMDEHPPRTEVTISIGIASAACAIENMLLAAKSLGLGACWVGPFPDAKEEFEAILSLKPPWELLALVPIGYTAEDLNRDHVKTFGNMVRFMDAEPRTSEDDNGAHHRP